MESHIGDGEESDTAKSLRAKTHGSRPARKPKWWRQIAGRRATKAQRRAIDTMPDYQLQGLKYGTMIDWDVVFLHRYKEIWLELGCGQGDTLLSNAHRLHGQGVAFVGADIHSPAVGTALLKMRRGLDENFYWTGYSLFGSTKDPHSTTPCSKDEPQLPETPITEASSDSPPLYSNVRLLQGDGYKILRHIPASSLSRVLLTFPDPFPKPNDFIYRFVQVESLCDIYRVLEKGHGQFMLATDHKGHFDWCKYVFAHSPDLFRRVDPCPDRMNWLPAISKYEQKGLDEGRQTLLACWEVCKGAEW